MTAALAALMVVPAWPVFAVAPSSTSPATTTISVLGLEAVDVPDTIALEIAEALRHKIAATAGLQLVPGKDLVEIKLVFACSDESASCMAQAGTTLGSARLIFGNVRRVNEDYVVTLKSVDVGRAAIDGTTWDSIPIKRAEPTVFQSHSSRWLAKLTGRETTGSLAVRANITGATITLDGVAVGLTDTLPLVVDDVAPGHHQIGAEKQGYAPIGQDFSVAAGQNLPLDLTLIPGALGVSAPAEPIVVRRAGDDSAGGAHRNLARVGFWTAVVGVATSAALALKFGNDVKSANRDLDPLRRYNCEQSPTGLCNKNGNQADPLTLAEKNVAASKSDDGNRAQRLQWVFVGLVPLFAIPGGYLLYKGYLDGESNGSSTGASRGLRIFPTASASAGGVMAEFDF